MYRRAIDPDFALLNGFEGIDGFDQGGFARTRRATHHHHLALGHLRGAPIEDLHRAVPFGDLFEFNHGFQFLKMMRTSAHDGHPGLQATHQARQGIANDKVDHGGDQVGLFGSSIDFASSDKTLEQIVSTNGIDQ